MHGQVPHDCTECHVCLLNRPTPNTSTLRAHCYMQYQRNRMLRQARICNTWLQWFSKWARIEIQWCKQLHNIEWRLDIIALINWAESPWWAQKGRLYYNWSQQGKLWGVKTYALIYEWIGKNVTICSQPPEWWFRSFAQSRWLLATMQWNHGEGPSIGLLSQKGIRPSARAWHLVLTTFGMHVEGSVARWGGKN